MRVAYVFERFPCPSETFALREIECLRRQGVHIVVFCAQRCAGAVRHGSLEIIAAPRGFGSAARGVLRDLLARRWMRLGRLAALLARLAFRSVRQAGGLLRDLPAVGAFAGALEAAGIRHVHGYWLGWPGRMAAAVSAVTGASMSLAGHARDIFVPAPGLDVLVGRGAFVAVCTEQGRRHLAGLLGGKQAAKLRLVRHGLLPEEMESPWPDSAGAGPEVLAVGRLVPKKGFDVLLRAFGRVRAARQRARLTLVGDGPEDGPLRRLASDLGLAGCTTFAGRRTHADTLATMRSARVLVVPSVIATDGDRDGTPNVILEAFACGTPVVASALAGIAEAVEPGGSGVLVPPGDPAALANAIARVCDAGPLREGLVRGGRAVLAERFDGMRNAARLAALLGRAERQ